MNRLHLFKSRIRWLSRRRRAEAAAAAFQQAAAAASAAGLSIANTAAAASLAQNRYAQAIASQYARPHDYTGPTRLREPSDVPDVVGYVYGFRVWTVEHAFELRGFELAHSIEQLRSLAADYTWRPGPNRARCLRGMSFSPASQFPHDSPHPDCSCGFWALWDFWHLSLHVHSSSPVVVGTIRGWGSVVEGSKGWRAEHAEIVALHGASGGYGGASELRATAEQYNVPVTPWYDRPSLTAR